MKKCEWCPIPVDSPCATESRPGRFADFCVRARSGDPTQVRHIVAVSGAIAGRPLPPPADPTLVPCGATTAPPGFKSPDIPLAGDVVEAIARRIGADRLAKLWERWTGVPCGCAERRERLNRATARLLRWLGQSRA